MLWITKKFVCKKKSILNISKKKVMASKVEHFVWKISEHRLAWISITKQPGLRGGAPFGVFQVKPPTNKDGKGTTRTQKKTYKISDEKCIYAPILMKISQTYFFMILNILSILKEKNLFAIFLSSKIVNFRSS